MISRLAPDGSRFDLLERLAARHEAALATMTPLFRADPAPTPELEDRQ